MSSSVARSPELKTTDVPFVDLSVTTGAVNDGVLSDVADLLATNAFTNGPSVAAFEEAFAEWVGAEHCVGLASGLDALRLGLLASEVGPGDEVVVPAMTFIATFEAVTQTGATPVVVDVGENDYNLDPAAADAAIGERTRALLPVHLYGQLADMTALGEIGRRAEVPILEDACQAHGAERDGHRAGASGAMAAFSFYPSKNLGAMGDAGAFVTSSDALARARPLPPPARRGREVPFRVSRLYRSARHDSGIGAAPQAAAFGRLERAARRRCRPLQRRARGRRRPEAASGRRRAARPFGTST